MGQNGSGEAPTPDGDSEDELGDDGGYGDQLGPQEASGLHSMPTYGGDSSAPMYGGTNGTYGSDQSYTVPSEPPPDDYDADLYSAYYYAQYELEKTE